MQTLNRRDFTLATLGALALGRSGAMWAASPTIAGVRVGAITYTFRDAPRLAGEDFLETGLRSCVASGLGVAELWATMVQPEQPLLTRNGQYEVDPANAAMVKARDDIRRWRIETPASYWQGIRRRFDKAGIELIGYSLTLADDFTDAEIDKTLAAVRLMGITDLGTNQTRVAMGKRVVPFAEKHGVRLCFHNHSNVDHANEVATIASMDEVLAMSKNYRINLDIGHFVGANLDPVSFIRTHHDRISYLHLKDRKRDNGPNMPWGQGDTPIKEVLQLVKKERYPIPCLIEYEYKGEQSPLAEVGKCVEYIRQALA
jgi:sugar phosphate isomerase/epimerase